MVHSGAGSFVASVDVQRCLCDAAWCSNDNGVGKTCSTITNTLCYRAIELLWGHARLSSLVWPPRGARLVELPRLNHASEGD